MAIYTHTVTHSVSVSDAAGSYTAVVNVVTALADDYDFTFAQILIEVLRRSSVTHNALAGQLEHAEAQTWSARSKRSLVTSRDIQQANADIRLGDVKFHVKASDASFEPVQGDQVTRLDTGRRFEIIAVDEISFGTRYRLWCRSAS